MPQLDFREALSTPEEQHYSTAVAVSATTTQTPPVFSLIHFLHSLRLSRSSWANIVFVTIASVGGLVSAFYFFNGGELLRAAASWPGEYLYPRPVAAESLLTAEQPTPVDKFGAITDQAGAAKDQDAKTAANLNAAPTDLIPPVNTIGSTTPPVVTTEPPPIVPVLPPIVPPPPTSVVDQVTGNVNTTVNGGSTLLQAVVQDPVGATSSTLATTVATVKKTKKTATTSRRKTQKLASTSSRSSLQQTATQTQIGTDNVRPVNQMMTGGGLGGGGSIGAIGGGAGAAGGAGGAGAGVVGGAAGGLGGLNAGGLGGTISGVGGTVGGVIGGHH